MDWSETLSVSFKVERLFVLPWRPEEDESEALLNLLDFSDLFNIGRFRSYVEDDVATLAVA